MTPPPTAQVSIKKYAKEITAQGDTQTSPIAIQPGENYNYYYQIQNTGAIAATDVMVKDTLPQYLNFTTPIIVKNASNTDVTNDWTILTGSSIFVGETLPRLTFIAKKKTPLPANSGLYTFTIPVAVSLTIPSATTLHNVAYVCASNDPTSPAECGTDTPPPPPPGGCASTVPSSHIDPACVTVTESFDLTLKKYVKSDDNFSSVNPTEDFNYNIIVTNEGIGVSSGLTTVRDILPAPVVLQTGKVPSGNGWDCSTSVGANITCTTSTSVTAHQVFNTITVPARVTNLTNRAQAYVNYAYVSNPNEAVGKRCRTDGALPDPSLG